MREERVRVALFLRYIGGGGAETAMVNLARGFVEGGLAVDFVVCESGGPHQWKIPEEVRIVDLKSKSPWGTVLGLVRYLRQERPVALVSALHFNNEIAIFAKQWARVGTRIVVCEQNTLSQRSRHERRIWKRLTPWLARIAYPKADAVVAVSHGVARDLNQVLGLGLEQIEVIYNPGVTPELTSKAVEAVEHPWFQAGEPPVILGVGKLEPQKDFPTLLRAFAEVQRTRSVRLMILGWGPEAERQKLVSLINTLGIESAVCLGGYVSNPYSYMARSAVFALSSRWEGLPFVLVEALAVGTAVVSTDCESGPSEILAGGQYGALVPVGDHQALAAAIVGVLEGKVPAMEATWLRQFSLETIARQYLKVMLPAGVDEE